jgi:hypothetical protein
VLATFNISGQQQRKCDLAQMEDISSRAEAEVEPSSTHSSHISRRFRSFDRAACNIVMASTKHGPTFHLALLLLSLKHNGMVKYER